MTKGLVYVFAGDGKGKTSAAFWTGMRMVLRKKRVAAVQFYKESRWLTAEQEAGKRFKNFDVFELGRGFYKLPTDHASGKEHKKAAEEGIKKAGKLIESGKYDLVILDEVNNAIADKLIGVDDLIEVIIKRGKVHLVLTGRSVNKKVVDMADLVTEMKKTKHPFDRGKKAVKGLDF